MNSTSSETLECLSDLLKASFENSLTLEEDGFPTNFFRIAIVCGVEREIMQIITSNPTY